MISKEVFFSAMKSLNDFEDLELHLENSTKHEISYRYDNSFYKIDKHRLVFFCKEWALEMGYILEERINDVKILEKSDLTYFKKCITDGAVVTEAYSPNRIFKACEWIYNIKG